MYDELLDRNRAIMEVESLLREVTRVTDAIDSIKSDDDQYYDTDEDWAYPMKKRLTELRKVLLES